MQVAKLTGSIVNTDISDNWIDSLVDGYCHQHSTHTLARIPAAEHSKSK